MEDLSAATKRIEELVRGNGVVEGVKLALREAAESAKRNEKFQTVVAKLETFKQTTIDPLSEEYLSEEQQVSMSKAFDSLISKLRDSEDRPKSVRKSLSQRLSSRLSKSKVNQSEELPFAEPVQEVDASPALPCLQPSARLWTGYEGNLTPSQQADLDSFREMMYATEYKEDILRWRDGPDRLLLRFLRAECGKNREFKLKKSKKRLEKTLQWRRENDVDSLLENKPPEWERFEEITAETEIIDNEGRLVVFTRAGYLANYLKVNEFTTEQWKRCMACLVEHRMAVLRRESNKRGYEISAAVMVYDMRGGLSLAARRVIPFIKLLNSVASAHYPELVDAIYVAACPKIFNMLYGLIQGSLDPVTKEKVKIYGNSAAENVRFIQDMRALVQPNDLPIEYGGDSDFQCPFPIHAAQQFCKMPKPFISS